MAAEPMLDIPVLTDAVGSRRARAPRKREDALADAELVERSLSLEREAVIAELQTEIAAGMFALTDDIMRKTFAEMEASIFEQISRRLRAELPEMIDAMLRARLGDDSDY